MRGAATRELFVVFILGLLGNGCLHQSKPQVAPDPLPTELQYFLPKTTIVLDVQVERSVQTPGKYCDFLDLYFPEMELVAACQSGDKPLPGKNLLTGKMKTAVVGYGMSLKGTADASRVHKMSFDSSWNVERNDSVTFAETGTLTGAEVQRTDRSAEIVIGILSNVAKIAGRFVFGGTAEVTTAELRGLPPKPAPWDAVAALKTNFELMDSERQKAYQDLWGTREGKARLTLATRSYETLLSDSKALASTFGNAAPGSSTVVPEMQKQIANRLAADFLGTSAKEQWTPTYELTPERPVAGKASVAFTLFTFAGCGVIEEKELPTKSPLSVLRCAETACLASHTVAFTVRTTSNNDASRVATPDTTTSSADVLYYVRPEPVVATVEGVCSANVTLGAPPVRGGTPVVVAQAGIACRLASAQSLLAQWGTQAAIPKAGKSFSYSVSLYDATGAVKSLKLSMKPALDTATVDSAFGIANTLIAARDAAEAEKKKKADKAATKADELNVLTRTREILEEKAKIKKLCSELGLTDCGG